MKTKDEHGNAYAAVRWIYDKSPGRSWRRLNGALDSTLCAAIEAHLEFREDDFSKIRHDMNGGYWMGNSEGDTTGERYYRLAVDYGHTQACIAFEKYAGRPAAMWPWEVKTPARLRIGSDLYWDGVRATVTNMRQDHLVACSYKASRGGDKLTIGDTYYFGDGYRVMIGFKRAETGGLIVQLGPPVPEPETSKVDRRFKILYADLAAKRREYDALCKGILAEIMAGDSTAALRTTFEAHAKDQVRPFDRERIQGAFEARRKQIEEKK